MRLVSYNIQYGRGRDGRFDLARIAAAVEGADVIALQEVDRFYRRTGLTDQPAALARLLPAYHWVYGPGLDLDASETGADGHPIMRRRQFGNMLLARTPILSSRNFMLPKFGTLIQFSLQRAALEGVIATARGAVRFYSIHLTHLADASRGPQVEALLDIHARAPAEGGAWCGVHKEEWTEGQKPPAMPREAILMGDFNLPPDSPLYARICGPLSPEHGRMNNLEGFVDAWVAAGHGEPTGITWPDASGGMRIDYCFVSAALAPLVRRAWIDAEAAGSDHQPIWTEIDL
ncbi:MAG: endonuclease/exonuclease/phosphatase family protein [Pseudomonadota bacterium]